MRVDVYKSVSNPEKFLSVLAGTDMSKLSVAALDADYQSIALLKKDVDIDPSVPSTALSSTTIIRDIDDHGFATHDALATTSLNA
jgi:hypothetical protein